MSRSFCSRWPSKSRSSRPATSDRKITDRSARSGNGVGDYAVFFALDPDERGDPDPIRKGSFGTSSGRPAHYGCAGGEPRTTRTQRERSPNFLHHLPRFALAGPAEPGPWGDDTDSAHYGCAVGGFGLTGAHPGRPANFPRRPPCLALARPTQHGFPQGTCCEPDGALARARRGETSRPFARPGVRPDPFARGSSQTRPGETSRPFARPGIRPEPFARRPIDRGLDQSSVHPGRGVVQ